MRTRLSWIGTVLLVAANSALQAEEPLTKKIDPDVKPTTYVNIPTPTLGGKQFWADELVFWNWRIQKNVVTGHYRLLDENNVRYAWGNFEGCRAALDEIKKRDNLPSMSGKVVIVLHGLGRSRGNMSGMAKHLKDSSKYTVLTIGYPSAMAEVEQHAYGLARVLENLEGVEEINFVGHSLGNIVTRRYLFGQFADLPDCKPDPRIKRIVMVGAPNNGAQFAKLLTSNSIAEKLMIQPGLQLGVGWDALAEKLATPGVEFGIIAGGKGDGVGYNPLLEGDDDLVVTVAETRIPGARDFLLVPALHTFMMDNETVQKATLKFLEHGHFVADDQRQPIEK
jgi:pimeloyl-ACP methyl ester carboxylesterase